MKKLTLNHTLTTNYNHEIISSEHFNAPNVSVVKMKRELHPNSELFVSVNHYYDENEFFHKAIITETLNACLPFSDGIVIDHVFTHDYHYIDTDFLKEISMLTQDKHLIVGPSFHKVPSFLQSKLLDELIEHDVSGVIYDLRHVDLNAYTELQDLAQLKLHAKKRISIVPYVNSEHEMEQLLKLIPFDIVLTST